MINVSMSLTFLIFEIETNTPTKVDELAARHSGYLRKDEEIGCLMMRMGDPLAEDANITNPADKVALEALLASVCGAAPLSPYTKLPGPAPTPAPAPAAAPKKERNAIIDHAKFFMQVCVIAQHHLSSVLRSGGHTGPLLTATSAPAPSPSIGASG